ncbi:hypothetical protein DPMN_168718 [Dreissena polymorpha]|uniref:Uncharacterized protein n=1 Tax=Dreissena polymorpha TaxID=45954 RepID=A0A9D4F372_DREPO|nr:hypothetical protein DPMN_168718 [Dreissena polymorpha]
MLSAVSFLLLVTLCGTVSSQTYTRYPPPRPYPLDPNCAAVICLFIVCPNGQYVPPGECCPRCKKGIDISFICTCMCSQTDFVKIAYST